MFFLDSWGYLVVHPGCIDALESELHNTLFDWLFLVILKQGKRDSTWQGVELKPVKLFQCHCANYYNLFRKNFDDFANGHNPGGLKYSSI